MDSLKSLLGNVWICLALFPLAPGEASRSPQVVSAYAGENSQIICTFPITNYHGNVIYWRFGETPIKDDSVNIEEKYNMLQEEEQGQTSTLTIFNTTLNDEGSYFCITPTNTEILEWEHQLIVNVPAFGLQLRESPSNEEIGNNGTVRIQMNMIKEFVCSVSNPTKPDASVAWRATEGVIISESETDFDRLGNLSTASRSIQVRGGPALHDKELICIVSQQSLANTLRASFRIEVQGCVHTVVQGACSRYIVESVPIDITCRLYNDTPSAKAMVKQLTINRDNSTRGAFLQGSTPPSTDGMGLVVGVFKRQAGNASDYRVATKCCTENINACGNVECSDVCESQLQYSPRALSFSRSYDGPLIEGLNQTQSIMCSSEGFPLPNVTWCKVTGNISCVNVADGTGSASIRFGMPHRNDSGIYECRAGNGLGFPITHLEKTIVFYAPWIIEHSQTVLADEGTEAVMTCTVDALPPPSSIKWLDHDGNTGIGVPVVEELWRTEYGSLTRSTLWLSDAVKENMYGNYTCSAVNSFGKASHTVSLTGNKFPPCPSSLSVSSSTETTISLQWAWTTDNTHDVTFTVSHCHDEALLQCTSFGGVTDRHFLISGLRSFTVYWISVKTVNFVGESVDAAKIQASTCPSPPEKYGVYASYNTVMHTLLVKSTTSFKDLCFHLEIRVAGVKHLNDTCLLPGEELMIGNDVQQGQLWLVACGRGTCSEPSLVQFVADGLSSDWVIISSTSSGSTGCALIILITLVCCLRLKRRKRLAAKAVTSMRSRTLPAVPFHGQERESTYVEPIHDDSTEYESIDHMAPAGLDVKGKPFQEKDAHQTAPSKLADQPYIPMYPVDNAATVIYETSLPLKPHQQQDEDTFKPAASSLRDDSYNVDYRLSTRNSEEDHYVLPSKVGK